MEDDPDISDLIEYLLADMGFNVTCYATVDAFDRRPAGTVPELLILDIMLPDGSGLDICRRWKADQDSPKIPVLIMSAHSEGKSLAQDVCADDFISKPFDINEFARRVQLSLAS